MNTEYIRNMHSNYVRLALDEKPEEQKYQYCILSRGGIKGLLPCSLRYLDGNAYLYYDITSKQNLVQFHQKGNISREWILDFVESLRNLQQELGRFLLQEDNVIWEPQHVFQDLESNVFSFLYLPYYNGENQFIRLLGFLVEKIDYSDELLVECVYKMYEQVEKNGVIYLQDQIFKDVRVLEDKQTDDRELKEKETRQGKQEKQSGKEERRINENENRRINEKEKTERNEKGLTPRTLGEEMEWEVYENESERAASLYQEEKNRQDEKYRQEEKYHQEEKDNGVSKKIFGIFESRKGKRQKEQEKREDYRESMLRSLEGYAVAEDLDYEESYGRTTFLTEKPEKKEAVHRLYFADGRKASELDTSNLLIGKYKEKVDLYLDDDSVSRMHARVLKDQDQYFLEDENSTNGTYCAKVRLQPYERKKLEPGDEVRIGNVTLFFR